MFVSEHNPLNDSVNEAPKTIANKVVISIVRLTQVNTAATNNSGLLAT